MQGAPNVLWTAAFAAGRITAIPLDSIEGLAPRDSARLAADLTRLASALKDDTSQTFRGLPFVVLRAYRAKATDTSFVVATLARRVYLDVGLREGATRILDFVRKLDAAGQTAGASSRMPLGSSPM